MCLVRYPRDYLSANHTLQPCACVRVCVHVCVCTSVCTYMNVSSPSPTRSQPGTSSLPPWTWCLLRDTCTMSHAPSNSQCDSSSGVQGRGGTARGGGGGVEVACVHGALLAQTLLTCTIQCMYVCMYVHTYAHTCTYMHTLYTWVHTCIISNVTTYCTGVYLYVYVCT